MCEFISWIEKDGDLFYLTDREVFSEQGKEILKGCKHNDYLGHEAIRLFYNIKGGNDHECRDFWDINKLPKELANKVKDFSKYWGGMFREYFQNEDLCHIIYYAPEPWKVKACQQLLKQKPSNQDLSYIIYFAPEKWKVKAKAMLK